MSINIFQRWRQVGNSNNRSSFSRCPIFLDFPIVSLFKLPVKFLCCFMLKVSILLQRIYTVITFSKSVICIYNHHILYFSPLTNYLCQVRLCKLHINWSGDIELNPGPKSNSCENVSLCHWNLSSIPAHNFSNVSLLNAYTSLHSFDIQASSFGFKHFVSWPQTRSLLILKYFWNWSIWPSETHIDYLKIR